MRGLTVFLGNFRQLEALYFQKSSSPPTEWEGTLSKCRDSLKYLIKQVHGLPCSKGRGGDEAKHLQLSERAGEENGKEWEEERGLMISEIAGENEILRVAIKEKDSHLQTVEGKLAKLSLRQEEKRTSNSLHRANTEKSSENSSVAPEQLQQYS